jgi:hypothetical protein
MSNPHDVNPLRAREILGRGLPANLSYPQQTGAQAEIKAVAREIFVNAMQEEGWSEEPDVEEIRIIARWAHDAAIIFLDELSQ